MFRKLVARHVDSSCLTIPLLARIDFLPARPLRHAASGKFLWFQTMAICIRYYLVHATLSESLDNAHGHFTSYTCS